MSREGRSGTDHGPVRDQTDESVRRQEGEGDDDGFFEGFQVVIVEARVDDEEEDGRDLGRTTEGVLDRRVSREQLRGEVRS